MAIATVAFIVIDSVDPDTLAPFWAELLGVAVEHRLEDGQYVILGRPASGGPRLTFQRVPEAKAGKVRIHLDLDVASLSQATAEIERLGGRWTEPGLTREIEGFSWRTMADPEGHEFDIASSDPA